MGNFGITGLTPFLPAKDFDVSLKFYVDLGFRQLVQGDKAVLLGHSSFSFWLQDYYVKDWAENCVLCLYVNNLEDWWSHLQSMNLDVSYNARAKLLGPPSEKEGAQMFHVIDPSGVLWHFRQSD